MGVEVEVREPRPALQSAAKKRSTRATVALNGVSRVGKKVALPVRTRGHDEWAIEKKAHGHAHDTSREGGVTEAQGRQGRNEAQVPESESSPGAEP